MKFKVFVSYCHKDADLVKPLVKFIIPIGNTVFYDSDSLVPGSKWRDEVAKAIQGCKFLYLFWCSHSSISEEVRLEYSHAVELGKKIVPVLLDNTELPLSIKDYQWVDLRPTLGPHVHTVEQRMSLQEGQDEQGEIRKEHGYKFDEYGYFGGDFARRGWELQGGEYIRRQQALAQPEELVIKTASLILQADLERRITGME